MPSIKTYINNKNLFLFGLFLIIVGMPLSKFLMSVGQFVLLWNWIIEGNFKRKWSVMKTSKVLWVMSSFYLLHLIGLFWTSDFDYAANDLKIKTYLINSKSKHSLNNLTELNKIIKTEKPDLIHVQAWNPMAGKFAILAARQNKIPLIVTEHDPFPLNWPKSLYKKWANQKVAKMITVSHTNQKMLEEIYPEMIGRLTTVHNGIEKFAVINDGKRQQIRREIFKAGPETKIILGVGTLHERKGFKYLISAYSKIHKDYPNSRLIIAGEGPERNSLENLIKNLSLSDKVFLIGQSNDVPALMQCSNLMVLPSLKEAFGLVLLEAMQAGLPIIASKVGGIPEIISSPEKGLLIEPANKNELVKSLHKLLSKDDLSKRFSQKGIEHWKNFSAKEMAEKTGQIYQEILD